MNASVDITDLRLETPRLILRPWRQEDLEDFYAYASVDGVGEMAGWTHHRSVEESQTILSSFIAGKKTFAIELKETGRVIGSLGIEKCAPEKLDDPGLYGRELGYVLSREYWGMGLMPEAARAVIDCCFHALRCDFLTCGHFKRNSRSRRVIEKCGFHYVKDSSYTTNAGAVEDTCMYILYNPNTEEVRPCFE